MKYYNNTNNELFAFEDDCFDQEGKVINITVKNLIESNSLTELSDKEYTTIILKNQANREEESTAQAELVQAEKDAEFLEQAIKWGMM